MSRIAVELCHPDRSGHRGHLYEIDPLTCPGCGSEMRVIAIIEDPDEIRHILRHLIKIGGLQLGWTLPVIANHGLEE